MTGYTYNIVIYLMNHLNPTNEQRDIPFRSWYSHILITLPTHWVIYEKKKRLFFVKFIFDALKIIFLSISHIFAFIIIPPKIHLHGCLSETFAEILFQSIISISIYFKGNKKELWRWFLGYLKLFFYCNHCHYNMYKSLCSLFLGWKWHVWYHHQFIYTSEGKSYLGGFKRSDLPNSSFLPSMTN